MVELQAILKYQEIDKKLYALERELAGCEERKEYLKTKKFLETAADKLDAFDAKAAQLKSAAVELTKKYGADEDYQFVNGLLGAVARDHGLDAEQAEQ